MARHKNQRGCRGIYTTWCKCRIHFFNLENILFRLYLSASLITFWRKQIRLMESSWPPCGFISVPHPGRSLMTPVINSLVFGRQIIFFFVSYFKTKSFYGFPSEGYFWISTHYLGWILNLQRSCWLVTVLSGGRGSLLGRGVSSVCDSLGSCV